MKETSNQITIPKEGQLDLFPFGVFLNQVGVKSITAWRWRQRGMIKTVSIGGKLYVTSAAIAEFGRRAKAGEFVRRKSLTVKKSSRGPGSLKQAVNR